MGVLRSIQISILMLLGVVVLLFFPKPLLAVENQWKKVEKHANQEVVQAQRDAVETDAIIKKEKEELLRELAELKNRVGKKESGLEELKKRFEELREKEEEMKKELDAWEEEIHTLEGAVKGASKDFDKILRNGLISPDYPELMTEVEDLATSDRFPSYKDIESLVNALFAYMKSSGEIVKSRGKLIDKDGKEAVGEIVRIGDFMSIYRSPIATGALRYDAKSKLLIAYPGKLPWRTRRAFGKYIEGSVNHLPLDLSHGAIFKEYSVERGIMEWLKSGGFLVWPILLIGAVAMALICERIVFLSRIKKTSTEVTAELDSLIQEGNFESCKEFCKKYIKIPTCRIIESGLENLSASKDVLENALQEAILQELPKIERFLPTLSVLAAIAPLLGLLGTVTGMINTFQVITQFGTSDPRMMSGGISEALVTTQLGLGVAIPILVMHHFLERQADKIIDEMEEKGTALTVSVLRAQDRSEDK